MFKAAEYIADDFVALFPAKIDVKVWRTRAVLIHKPLEVQVELERIHISDAQQVSHNAIGSASAPHIVKPSFLSVLHDVVVNQEIRDKLLLLYE